MKNYLKISLVISVILVMIYGCEGPADIPSPSHFNRTPKPYNLIADSAKYDTTAGKARVYLRWEISSMANINYFEVQRKGLYPVFARAGVSEKTSYVDSFAVAITDTLKLSYYLIPNGIDRFVGESSDILSVNVVKPK
ncbi:MAG: hypothetical protein AB9882_02035 [Ignavibacteriaceae bacterium]